MRPTEFAIFVDTTRLVRNYTGNRFTLVTSTAQNPHNLTPRSENVRFVGLLRATDSRLSDGYRPSELESKLAEMLLIEHYKAGDQSLSEVSETLGLYPDVKGAMTWLNQRGVVQEMAPGERVQCRALNQQILEVASMRLSTHARKP